MRVSRVMRVYSALMRVSGFFDACAMRVPCVLAHVKATMSRSRKRVFSAAELRETHALACCLSTDFLCSADAAYLHSAAGKKSQFSERAAPRRFRGTSSRIRCRCRR